MIPIKKFLSFLGPEEVPGQIHLGLRTIKTVIAVLICAMLGWLRGDLPLFSMIACVLCIQQNTALSVKASVTQMLGAIIGGAFGVGVVYLCGWIGVYEIVPAYYSIVALLLIPLILLTLVIKKPSISATTCIVFIAVSIVSKENTTALEVAAFRMLDTLIGIVVALAVNIALPNNRGRKREKTARQEGGANEG